MTIKQISQFIVTNKCVEILIEDYSGNKLDTIIAKNAPAAAGEFEERAEEFKEYGKLQICARLNEKTTWGNAFCWQLNFRDGTKKGDGKSIEGPSNIGAIGAMDYIAMFTQKESQISQLHREKMELQMQLKDNDPSKYLPLVYAGASALGIDIKLPQQIQSPPKNKLISGDVHERTLPEIQAEINVIIDQLATKMKASQFLEVLQAVNKQKDLQTNIDKVIRLLDYTGDNPAMLDTALQFIPK